MCIYYVEYNYKTFLLLIIPHLRHQILLYRPSGTTFFHSLQKMTRFHPFHLKPVHLSQSIPKIKTFSNVFLIFIARLILLQLCSLHIISLVFYLCNRVTPKDYLAPWIRIIRNLVTSFFPIDKSRFCSYHRPTYRMGFKIRILLKKLSRSTFSEAISLEIEWSINEANSSMF